MGKMTGDGSKLEGVVGKDSRAEGKRLGVVIHQVMTSVHTYVWLSQFRSEISAQSLKCLKGDWIVEVIF